MRIQRGIPKGIHETQKFSDLNVGDVFYYANLDPYDDMTDIRIKIEGQGLKCCSVSLMSGSIIEMAESTMVTRLKEGELRMVLGG